MSSDIYPPKVIRLAEKTLATTFGNWREVLYTDGRGLVAALAFGTWDPSTTVPCRIQSHCLSGFVFSSVECDCRKQLEVAQLYMQERGAGVVVWLDQDGRGHGHMAYMLASELASQAGVSQSEAYERLGYSGDPRSYGIAASVILDLGIGAVELLSNNPERAAALRRHGIDVDTRRPLIIDSSGNDFLSRSYRDKESQGHVIDLPQKER
jgi:GTP cyclohydrolase II